MTSARTHYSSRSHQGRSTTNLAMKQSPEGIDRGARRAVAMEVRQLRYFVTVAECEHFGRAAEALHIVQPAGSKQVARLERELGLTLLGRSRRRARITPDGQAFLAHARRALRGIDRAAAAAGDIAAGNTGLLRIGSSVVFSPRIEAA